MDPGEPGAPGPERVRAAVAVQGWEAQAVPGEESTIVYYRLEVRLVRADGTAAASHTVLRRFSDFRRLHAVLVEVFPDAMADKPPPPKKQLARVNSSENLIGQRQALLEKWLWRVLEDPELAFSGPLAAFLQFEAAKSQLPGGAVLEGAEARPGSSAPIPVPGEPGPGAGGPPPPRRPSATDMNPISPELVSDIENSSPKARPGLLAGSRPAPATAAARPPSPPRPAGPDPGLFNIRGAAPAQIQALRNIVESAMNDRRYALDCLEAETATKEFLGHRVNDLENELGALRKKDLVGREEMEREVGALKASIAEEGKAWEWQKEEWKAERGRLEADAAAAAERAAALEARLAEAEARHGQEAAAASAALEEARGATAALQAEHGALQASAKADIKLLAGEVHALGKKLAEAEGAREGLVRELEDAARETEEDEALSREQELESEAAFERMMQEVSSLRSQLAACSLDKLGMEDGGAAGADDTERDLDLSDDRLAVMIAQAQVLSDSPAQPRDNGSWQKHEAQLRNSLASLLIDQASLRKVTNSLMRASLRSVQEVRSTAASAKEAEVERLVAENAGLAQAKEAEVARLAAEHAQLTQAKDAEVARLAAEHAQLTQAKDAEVGHLAAENARLRSLIEAHARVPPPPVAPEPARLPPVAPEPAGPPPAPAPYQQQQPVAPPLQHAAPPPPVQAAPPVQPPAPGLFDGMTLEAGLQSEPQVVASHARDPFQGGAADVAPAGSLGNAAQTAAQNMRQGFLRLVNKGARAPPPPPPQQMLTDEQLAMKLHRELNGLPPLEGNDSLI